MRLIDADALKKLRHDYIQGRIKFNGSEYDLIDKCPTIDAVPVVRCKNCIHWLNEDGLEDHVCLKIYSDAGVHSVAWLSRKPDDFCSDGKRRSNHDSLGDQTEEVEA